MKSIAEINAKIKGMSYDEAGNYVEDLFKVAGVKKIKEQHSGYHYIWVYYYGDLNIARLMLNPYLSVDINSDNEKYYDVYAVIKHCQREHLFYECQSIKYQTTHKRKRSEFKDLLNSRNNAYKYVEQLLDKIKEIQGNIYELESEIRNELLNWRNK